MPTAAGDGRGRLPACPGPRRRAPWDLWMERLRQGAQALGQFGREAGSGAVSTISVGAALCVAQVRTASLTSSSIQASGRWPAWSMTACSFQCPPLRPPRRSGTDRARARATWGRWSLARSFQPEHQTISYVPSSACRCSAAACERRCTMPSTWCQLQRAGTSVERKPNRLKTPSMSTKSSGLAGVCRSSRGGRLIGQTFRPGSLWCHHTLGIKVHAAVVDPPTRPRPPRCSNRRGVLSLS